MLLPPVLFSVKVCGWLTRPTGTLPKDRGLGVSEKTGSPPTAPLRETTWVEPAALSVKLRVAVRVPVAVGVKVTETEQVAAGASDDPQVLLV